MVSTRPLISKSSSPFNNPLVTVPKTPITIGITVTFMFHSFFQFPNKVQVFILLFTFFQFYSIVSRDSKVHNFASSLFFFLLLIVIRSGLLVEIRRSIRMSKSYRSLCDILLDRCWVVHIPYVRIVKFHFLAKLPVYHLAHLVVSSLILLLC